jgi:hypothetical protein
MRLDLPRNPSRYLEARVQRDGRGRLLLGVRNPTTVAVADVAVRVQVQDTTGRVSEGTRRLVGVAAGSEEWILLAADASAVQDARAAVVAARVVETTDGSRGY